MIVIRYLVSVDELEDESDDDEDSALVVELVSDIVAGLTLTGFDFSGKYNGPCKPQASRHAEVRMSKAIRNIVTPERWLAAQRTIEWPEYNNVTALISSLPHSLGQALGFSVARLQA